MIINDFTPAEIDIIIPQGSTVQEFFTIYTDVAQTVPMDLTDYTGITTWRKFPGSAIIEFQQILLIGAQLVNGVITPASPANGGIAITYLDGSTSLVALKGCEYQRDVVLNDSTGVNRVIIIGQVTLIGQISPINGN